MAQAEYRRTTKNGEQVYRIRASCGYGVDGKKKTQSITWKSKKGMTQAQIDRALIKVCAEFDAECKSGKTVNAQKLQTFIENWFTIKQSALTASSVDKYRDYCPRIYSALGHMRIDKITTGILDKFLASLGNELTGNLYGHCIIDLKSLLSERGITQKALAAEAGLSPNCVRSCYYDDNILWDNAVKIANALKMKPNAIFEQIDKRQNLSSSTIRGYHDFLSDVFSYAVKIGELKVNPSENCTLPKKTTREHKIWQISELQRFLQLLDEERVPLKYKAYFNIIAYCGFRESEVLGLSWEDIDFDTNMIRIKYAQHWSKELGYYYTAPKTEASKRSIKVTDRVMLILKQRQNEQMSAMLNYGSYWNNPRNLVHTSNTGAPMSMSTPNKWLGKFCDKHNLPQITSHSFRHMCVSNLIYSGVDIKTVQSYIGHSTPSTTMNIYAHEIQSAQAAASNILGNILEKNLLPNAEAKNAE